jgi:hypothetical protein
MFEEILSTKAKNSLALLGKSGLLQNAYLAGGTALALLICHRISVDFDFFTAKKFDGKLLARKLVKLPIGFQLESLSEGTLLGYLGKIKFSLFYYDYPLLEKPKKFLNINIAGIKDIASMKIVAISDRGTKRDFIDLYFILAVEKLFILKEILNFYDTKFKTLRQNKLHILKSLTYFEDADKDPIPQMIKEVHWSKVKKFFEQEGKNFMLNKI